MKQIKNERNNEAIIKDPMMAAGSTISTSTTTNRWTAQTASRRPTNVTRWACVRGRGRPGDIICWPCWLPGAPPRAAPAAAGGGVRAAGGKEEDRNVATSGQEIDHARWLRSFHGEAFIRVDIPDIIKLFLIQLFLSFLSLFLFKFC